MERLNQSMLAGNKDYPIKVLQFGEGNFLRAFVDWMIYEMNQKSDFNAGVAVVQPMPFGLIDKFIEQDGLYHHFMNGIENGEPVRKMTLIDVLKQFVNPYESYETYLELAELESIEFIVSNTTEAGIAYEAGDTLDKVQKSFPAKVTAWLYHRYKHFSGDRSKGIIFLPCELIEYNGKKLKEIVVRYAQEWALEADFLTWINEANTFTSTLVDRIVPGFPKDRINEVYEEMGCEDHVVCESELFHLWVIEGPQSLNDKIPHQAAGLNIVVTDDMTPYRTRKVRILNGAHTSLVPVGLLYGIDQVKESIEDPVVGPFINALLDQEVIPTLDMSLEELQSFKAAVIDRFRNPYIKHYLASIALNSISKFKTRVLPSMVTYINENKALPERILFSFASLVRLYKGDVIDLKDDADILAFFNERWENEADDIPTLVHKVLSNQSFWGEDLTSYEGVEETVCDYLQRIQSNDYQSVVKTFV